MGMKTKDIILPTLALAICLGCKKVEKESAVSDAIGSPAVGAEASPSGAAAQDLNQAQAEIDKQNYEAAVGALVRARSSGSAEEQAQSEQKIRDVTQQLLEASQRDPKAKEAYENLGRAMLGR
jgi:hypothetical protein